MIVEKVTKITRGEMDKARRDMLKMVASVAGGVALTSMVGNAFLPGRRFQKPRKRGRFRSFLGLTRSWIPLRLPRGLMRPIGKAPVVMVPLRASWGNLGSRLVFPIRYFPRSF